jgi:hypothetical protein
MIGASVKAIRVRVLRISEEEVSFSKRGFYSTDEPRKKHLENVGASFLRGYHLALEDQGESLASWLNAVDPEYRGFSFEGAAMALGLLDMFSITRRDRLSEFILRSGAAHRYVCHVGYGWVLARLPWCRRHPERYISSFDPLLSWLVLDGFGFHEGYFHGSSRFPPNARTSGFPGYAARAFDQGLGRSIWFAAGADPCRTAEVIRQFDSHRHADLWSGIGLASAFAGAPTANELASLMAASGPHILHLGQGVAFAAEARQLASIPMPHTELACKVVCGMSAEDAAYATQYALKKLTSDPSESHAYEEWRSAVRALLRESMASCI